MLILCTLYEITKIHVAQVFVNNLSTYTKVNCIIIRTFAHSTTIYYTSRAAMTYQYCHCSTLYHMCALCAQPFCTYCIVILLHPYLFLQHVYLCFSQPMDHLYYYSSLLCLPCRVFFLHVFFHSTSQLGHFYFLPLCIYPLSWMKHSLLQSSINEPYRSNFIR